MKLKQFFYGLGMRPKPVEFPCDVVSVTLPKDGEIQLAHWKHPKEKPPTMSQAQVDALRQFLRQGDVVIDIGAHTGDTTVPFALAVGPTGLVLALEPNPYVFKVLQTNARLNPGKINIRPLMFAATQEDGVFEFEYSDAGFCNGGMHSGISAWKHAHFFKLKVQGRNLMNFLTREFAAELPRIRYVKIDTEGYDRTVASSIEQLLRTNRPYLRTEIYKHLPLDQRRGYHADLRRLGYRLHKYQDDEHPLGPELAESDMGRWSHFDIFALPARSPQIQNQRDC